MSRDFKLLYELCLSTYGVNKTNLRGVVAWYKSKISFWNEKRYLLFLDRYKI